MEKFKRQHLYYFLAAIFVFIGVVKTKFKFSMKYGEELVFTNNFNENYLLLCVLGGLLFFYTNKKYKTPSS